MRQSKLLSHFKSKGAGSTRKRRRDSSDDDSDVSADSDVRAIAFEDRGAGPASTNETDSGSDNDENAPQPRRSTLLDSSPAKKKRRLASNSSDEDLASDENDSPPRPSGNRKADPIQIISSDEEEESRPRRRKIVRGKRPAARDSDDNEDEDLQDGLDQRNVINSRLRQPAPAKKSKFSAALERMKERKRQKGQGNSSPTAPDFDLGSDSQSNTDSDRPFAGSKPEDEITTDDDASLDDFIAEDDGNTAEFTLPAQFRAAQHLSVHFKVVCQYFVHLYCSKNRTKFVQLNKTNEYFAEPLSVIRRKLSGIQDSQVTSSVWRPDFKKSLKTWPEISIDQLEFSIPSCDACHLGSRVSTLVGHVSGYAYNRQTFETVGEGEDTEELKRSFHLGRFCARRTRVYHRFAHWEHELFTAFEERVKSIKGYRKMTPDAVMEKLDERGIVEQEWKRMNEMIESAGNLEVAAKRGEDADAF